MTTRADQKQATRQSLVGHARAQLAARGYAAVSIPEVVAAAGLTKGAVYHHFAGKTELFAAVLEQVQQEVADAVARAADAETEPWASLLAGCRAFLEVSTDVRVRQIMLIDGPRVLGWQRWRVMDRAGSAAHLADALGALMDGGALTRRPVEPLTHLLSGAMNEAALWLARPDARSGDLDDVVDALTALLRGAG